MAERVYRLAFRGPVHFGGDRLSESAYGCDAGTIFSALYLEALRMGLADGLLAAVRSGELWLSDALPYIGDELYVPKPVLLPGMARGDADETDRDPRMRKAAKKLAYIPSSRLDAYIGGTLDFVGELDRFDLGVSELRGKVAVQRSADDKPRPFFVGSFSFAPGAGLYVLTRGSYDLGPILESLAYAGLGGKRSSGYGRFSFEEDRTEAIGLLSGSGGPGRPGHAMLLSSAAPTSEELTDDLLAGAGYRLVRKGGFVQSATHARSAQKKRDLYVFAAGSVFERTFLGDVFDVNATPGAHPVYRYARALWMEV